ncbi:MAG: sterol desaturase family protein [Pirellulales bacterium]
MSPHVEITSRLAGFLGVLVIMTLAELAAPRRTLTACKGPRWASNLALVVINTLTERLLIPITAVAAAIAMQERSWGLLHLVAWPTWLELLLAVVAFDLAIYAQHVAFHHVPLLWRLHLVHHADLDIDVTTGLRFHTLEILLSALIKLAVVVALGLSATAVVIFEVLLNATSMFNHSNVRLPLAFDRVLRRVLVTPDMHRVHHSVRREETDSNFGFNLPWWDFLFRTYRDQPADGHKGMTIGLVHLRNEQQVDRLPGMMALPLRSQPRPGGSDQGLH